jgi:hypothetical protein
MLGHLRMNVGQAIGALVSLASMLFPEVSDRPFDREENLVILKQVIEDTLQARGFASDMKMNNTAQPATRCKVYAYPLANATFPNIILGLFMRRPLLTSTTLKSSVPTPLEDPVSTQRSSKRFAPQWQLHPSFHQSKSDQG